MAFETKTFKPREFKVTKAAALDYEVGDTVRHIKFGVGIVKDIVDGGRDYEVTVDFDKVGIKKMFAGFAKLKNYNNFRIRMMQASHACRLLTGRLGQVT